jgi:Cdc6-like AAA superfamily ATPase
MNRFEKINFKYTDAEEEKLYAPELIDQAYVDINCILEEIEKPENFLVIGQKGSGKTALSSKLQLMEKSQWNLFVETDELEQFEYSLLNKCGAQKGTSIGGALTVWQLILSIRLLSLFLKDEKFNENNPDIKNLHNNLVQYGLADSSSIISIVQYTSRRGIFGKIKSAISEVKGEKTEEENYKLKDPAAIFAAIKEVLKNMTVAESRYFLVLDGLDHILRKGRNNAPYIADLINAVRQLNIFFRKCGIIAKVIILIRNEVLQIVPDPNLTKRINDNGVHLKWYDNTRSPFETSLLSIVEKRANLVGIDKNIKTLWYEWFPTSINTSNSFDFVILNTRYLPRDLISFFREVQKLGKKPKFNRIDVLSALNNYSDWFQQELSDALVGLIDENLRVELPDIMSTLGREFSLSQFKTKLKEHGVSSSSEAERIARELFNASWIGNVWKTEQGTPRYSWKHRKLNAKLNLKHQIIVHHGLWKSLNLI